MRGSLQLGRIERGKNMRKCKSCESVELVYSGVDAFILGVPSETYCYPCANEIKSKSEGAIIC